MGDKESLKNLAFYQSLSNEFFRCPADFVPLSPELIKFHLKHSEFVLYSILINKLRFILPAFVTEIPVIETSASELAQDSELLEDEVVSGLHNLEALHGLLEIDDIAKDRYKICLYDITQVAGKRGK
ncbi:MAG: hypothetical protein NC489_39310 [Ruminococcus flavefaciens]|nr:hypothetical protein [Ruminococcus flavefaciens]